jgi:hypothetical protein
MTSIRVKTLGLQIDTMIKNRLCCADTRAAEKGRQMWEADIGMTHNAGSITQVVSGVLSFQECNEDPLAKFHYD